LPPPEPAPITDLGASGRNTEAGPEAEAEAGVGAEATPPAMVEEERERPENQEVGAGEVIVTAAAAPAARLTGSRRGHRGRGCGHVGSGGWRLRIFWAGWIELLSIKTSGNGNGFIFLLDRNKFDKKYIGVTSTRLYDWH
jgi:hypothetical protein